MNMAIEIVDLPIKNGGFSIYIYTYMVFIVVKDAINQQQWEYDSYILVGGLEHDWIIFHFVYGMSSFPLTNSYFSRWLSHHQPVPIWNILIFHGEISHSPSIFPGQKTWLQPSGPDQPKMVENKWSWFRISHRIEWD